MEQEFNVSTVPFGDRGTNQRGVAIIFGGIGVAFCFDVEQAYEAIEAFDDILADDAKEKIRDFFTRELEGDAYHLPKSDPDGQPLEVRRDVVGKLFATLLSRNAQLQQAFEIIALQSTGGKQN